MTIALSAGRAPARASSASPARTNGRASRATTRLLDATFPAYRSLLPSEWAVLGRHHGRAARRGGQPRRAGRRPQHAGAAGVRRRLARADRRRRRRGPGRGEPRGQLRRRADHYGVQPAVPAGRAGRARHRSTARMLFTSPNKPVVLRPEGAAGGDYTYVIDAGPPARLVGGSPHVRPAPVRRRLPQLADARTSRFEPGAVACWSGRTGRARPTWSRRSATSATLGSHRVSTDAPLVRAGRRAGGGARAPWSPAGASCESRSRSRRAGRTGPGSTARRYRGPRPPRRAAVPCCSRPRTSRSSAATRASGAASSTSCSSPARRGWPGCAPTTSGCSSNVRRC